MDRTPSRLKTLEFTLILVLIVIAASPSPALAVTGRHYQYSVRHEKGASPFFPYQAVENETVNSANGNLCFLIPLLSRPGRNGLGVDLKLAYNSKIWEQTVVRGVGQATIAERDSWVGLGWTLRIARVIDDSANGHVYVTLSDGSNHDLLYYWGAWRSLDSTYMRYDAASAKLTLRGGTTIRFDYVDPLDSSIRHATRVQDTNGNYIEIAYAAGGGRISTIQDTLDNTYTFVLENNRLRRIRYLDTNGTERSIWFYHQAISPAFGSGYTTDLTLPQQYGLMQVYYPTNLSHNFTYNASGELEQITYPTCGKSRYFYATKQVLDRLLGYAVLDHYVASHDTGSGSTPWTWTGDPGPSYPAPQGVTIDVASSMTVSHAMTSGGYAEGFLTAVVEPGSPGREIRQDWTQDDVSLPFILNPRLNWKEERLKSAYNGPDKVVRTEFTYVYYGDWSGNLREMREYAFGGGLRRKTVLAYLHESNPSYANLNITDRVTQILVYNGTGTVVSRTDTSYDLLTITASPGAIRHDPAYGTSFTMRGLPTHVTRYYDIANLLAYTSLSYYDECGNARWVHDNRGNATAIEYWLTSADNAYAFPLRVINPLGHASLATYSYRSGAMLSRTDANSQVTAMLYDHWDRLTKVTRPSGGVTEYVYTDTANCDPPPPTPPTVPYVTITETIAAPDVKRNRKGILDKMGRLTETVLMDSGNDIHKETSYTAAGLIDKTSQPYRSGQTRYWTSYGYSGSMVTSVQIPDSGTVTYLHDTNLNTVTNTDGKKRRYEYQEDGKVSQVVEEDASGQLTVSTSYVYDALSRLIQINQGVQVRSFTYDALGRLKTETHPESGTTTHTYDGNGNLLARTDARGITTTSFYDALNRVTQKTYSDSTPAVYYSYDSQPAGSPIAISNPVGRLTKVTTTTGGVTVSSYYSYCNCSSVERESTVIADGQTRTYTTSYAYNLAGELTMITYPDGKVVSYTRDSMGRETKVSSTIPGRGIDYVRSAAYGASDGSLTSISYGIRYSSYPYSYLATSWGRSAATGRLVSLTTHGLSLSYQYGLPGNPGVQTGHIYDIVDQYAGDNSWHYEYDRWYRLSSAWMCNQRTDPYLRKWAFTYDQYGNITNVFKHFWAPTIPQGYDVPYSVNGATNRLTSRTYDAAGNMTTMGAFDAENRLVSSGGVGYLYDGHGRRVRKLQNGTKTHYVYALSGRLLVEANWAAETYRNQVYFGGQLVATHDQGNYVRFVFKDHLGSTRSVVRVDPNGSNWETDWETTEVYSYWPYGDVLSSMVVNEPAPSRDKYTGKPRDENNLDYFGARYYEPGDGLLYGNAGTLRWISADSVTAHLYDPPSLNKYVYARNDPMNLIDPDGKQIARPCYWQWASFTTEMGRPLWGIWCLGGDPWVGNGGLDPADGGPLSGGGRDPKQVRVDFLTDIRGDNDKNILDRIIGDCAALIDAMIKQLQPSYAYPSARDFVSWQLKTAVQWNYFGANEKTGIGLNAGGWAYAFTDDNTIYLGERFFSDQQHDHILTIIHEIFHLKAISANRDKNLTEEELAAMASEAGYSGASWQQIVSSRCGKK